MAFEKQYTWNGEAPIDGDSALILSHIIPSRTNALDQTFVSTNGIFEISNNNDLSNYGRHNQGRSAQFYNTYFPRMKYWNKIMIEFKDE